MKKKNKNSQEHTTVPKGYKEYATKRNTKMKQNQNEHIDFRKYGIKLNKTE